MQKLVRIVGLFVLLGIGLPVVAETDATSSAADAAASAMPAAQPSKNLPSDVRVLIDISGSMKQTDPHNLRKPAMDLIVRLLPDKSRAGVWTFGTNVNVLVPLQPVNAQWRKQAAPKANQISSADMFTGIGKALDEVTADRKSLDPNFTPHIILLTDGVVDIGKDPQANSHERERILTEILPQLKAAGYHIHTIALSADADTELLKKLSLATDGIATTAISADQLMGVFLKIFDQAVPAERVPLDKDGFLVDASIKEFTALIFRKPNNDRTIIADPDGKEFSATSPADGINWYRTEKYDLITADSPKAGQWKVKTEIAPQSRVTVVSNLELVVAPLRNNIHSNDSLNISYSFQENGKTVTNKDFLGLLSATSIVAKDGTEDNYATDFPQAIPEDGIFHQTLSNFAEVGDYEVHLYVDGKTFKREFKHSLSVRDSEFVVEKSKAAASDGKESYSYKISTDEKLVDVKSLQVVASIKNSPHTLNKTLSLIEPNRWEFSFIPNQSGNYQVSVHAEGKMLDGSPLDEVLQVDAIDLAPAPTPSAQSSSAAPVAEKHDEKPQEKSNNWTLYASIVLGNLLIVVLGYFGYKTLLGSKAKDELDEIEKTLSASKAGAAKTSASAPKSADKPEIDLSDEDPEPIPMNDDSGLDKLFPLDSLDDGSKRDDE